MLTQSGQSPCNSTHGSFMFEYRLIDIRTLDGDRLLESDSVSDNVIAILARLSNHKEAVRRIVERIAGLGAGERETALAQLLILAGLRSLSRTVVQETLKMPIDLDIRDHEVLGPIIIEAERKGELTVLRRQIREALRRAPEFGQRKAGGLIGIRARGTQ